MKLRTHCLVCFRGIEAEDASCKTCGWRIEGEVVLGGVPEQERKKFMARLRWARAARRERMMRQMLRMNAVKKRAGPTPLAVQKKPSAELIPNLENVEGILKLLREHKVGKKPLKDTIIEVQTHSEQNNINVTGTVNLGQMGPISPGEFSYTYSNGILKYSGLIYLAHGSNDKLKFSGTVGDPEYRVHAFIMEKIHRASVHAKTPNNVKASDGCVIVLVAVIIWTGALTLTFTRLVVHPVNPPDFTPPSA